MKTKSWMELIVRVVCWVAILGCTYYLIIGDSQADVYIDGSLGMFQNGQPSPANVKLGQVGYREFFDASFYNQIEGGGWVQTDRGDGRKSSGYVADQIGIQVENGILLRIATGPSFISTSDSFLGGHFQFKEDLFIGIRDKEDSVTMGFKYQHFSSAGFEMPNLGRDFMGLELSFPW